MSDSPSPTAPSRRRRRWLVGAIVGVIVVVWSVAAALVLVDARRQAQSGIDLLSGAREDLGATQLVRGAALGPVERAHTEFSRAHDEAGSWLLTPFRILPVIGRQVRSVDALTGSAATVTEVGAETMHRAKAAVAAQPPGGPGRIRLVEQLGGIAEGSGTRLRAVDLGPDDALIGPLADARTDFASELARLRAALADLESAADGLAPILRGPSNYLVLAANNAEMRAGSGMFLSVGVLSFENGTFSLSDMTPTSDVTLPPGAVPVTGDFAARWGWTHPNEEWRNLAMTPRFDASAELAVRMWQWRNPGQTVDGVLAIDPVALQALLAATGPVEVDGQQVSAETVVEEVLLSQYRLTGDDVAQAARRERLGAIARAAVGALDRGGWDTATLLDELRNAAKGRHLLAWSGDPTQERAWRGIGIDGELSADSVLLALLNRGGNKLDQFMSISSRLELTPRGSRTEVTIRSSVTNGTPAGLPRYVAGPFPGRDGPAGTYVGIFAIDVPGSAQDITIDDGAPLVAAGPDGPARVVATDISLAPGAQRELVVRFTLPPGVRQIQIEPTARIPAVEWRDANGSWPDGDARVVSW